ncbi:MAG: UbiA family prenyltransferase [Opitutae bacterium]
MNLSFSAWMSMARGANLPTVWTNVIAAWAINAGAGPSLRWMPDWTDMGFFDPIALAWLVLGASLVYAGGCFLNDACDHQFDRDNRPERPIPQGDLSPVQAWALGVLQLGLGGWSLVAGAGCSWKWMLGLLLCILAYDLVHKKTVWGILLMGGCRSLLWITAGTAAGGMSPAPLLYVWAVAIGAYVVGISWYARSETKSSEQKDKADRLFDRIPIVLLFIAPLLSLAYLVLWNNLDPIRTFLVNLVGLLAGGIAFFAILKMREGQEGSIGQGVSRLLAGICAVDATALSFHAPLLVGPCVLLGAIAHILQKKFAAT